MSVKPLPDSVKTLIEGRTFANFATLMPDGSPHVTQTWVDHEGELVVINTFEGSQKHKNAARDPRVALTIIDPKNEFHMAVIRGRVKEITLEGAEEHIDRMSMKYLGQPKYQKMVPARRILIKIEPTRVIPPWTNTRPRGNQRE
ncbi:MAG TPA: PPOX class F420-dependent oxidoreductase [Nitrososphaerales archaeon]|nr:PPOX class F420-dependent oxidoreductase [Nitrososphaerales archaeon]